MTSQFRQPSRTIEIDGQPFFLAEDPDTHALLWAPRSFPTQEGDPTTPRRFTWSDWSRGMGDSRGMFRGAVQYASKAYLGMPGRILPGPKINVIAGGHNLPVTCFATVTAPAARVLSGGGQYIKEIDPVGHTVAATQDFGLGATVLDMQLFIDQVAVALGDATIFQRRSAAGLYSANTLTGNNRFASSFGLSVENDLWKSRSYFLSKCTVADFYGTDVNWSAESDVGDRAFGIADVFAFQRADYVLKPEGLYSFYQESSKESNVLPVLSAWRSSENKRYFLKDSRMFLCTLGGLVRLYHQGPARNVGVEEQEYNESALTNVYPTAGVGFGKWQCEAWYDSETNTTYILLAREYQDGDATRSPSTEVCCIDSFTGQCRAMIIPSNVTTRPEVWYARHTDIAWFDLTRTGLPRVYETGATTRVELAPTDFGAPSTMKYWRGLEIVGRNAAAGRTMTFKAKNDEGAEYTVGSLAALTARYGTVFWTPQSNDSGRSLGLAVEMTNDSTTTPPEVRIITLNYEERPIEVAGFQAVLRFEDYQNEGEVATRLTALEQRQLLEGYLDGRPVTVVDPEGSTYTAAVFRVDGTATRQRRGATIAQTANIGVRRLDYS